MTHIQRVCLVGILKLLSFDDSTAKPDQAFVRGGGGLGGAALEVHDFRVC